jgi:pyruvate-formate lyase-activating enzyme
MQLIPQFSSWLRGFRGLPPRPAAVRKSCHYLESGLILFRNALRVCCSHHHHTGSPLICDYTGGPFPIEIVLARRHEIREANRTGVHPECDGCSFLIEKEWPEPTHLIDTMDIVYSAACPLRCIYCYSVKYPEMAITSDYDLYATLENMLETDLISPAACILWTGGEPTVFPRFEECFRLLSRGQIRNRVFTSGVCFSQAVFDGVLKGNVELVCSIDAGTRETYAEVKGRDVFDQVTEVCERYATAGGIFVLKYICLEQSANRADALGFLEFAARAGVGRVLLDCELEDTDPSTRIVDTLGFMSHHGRRLGLEVEFYHGVRAFPELEIPARAERAAQREAAGQLDLGDG